MDEQPVELPKDPDETKRVSANFTDWTTDLGVLITDADWSVEPPDELVVVDNPQPITDGKIATCWVEGGEEGVTYQVRCKAITDGLDTAVRRLPVAVRKR